MLNRCREHATTCDGVFTVRRFVGALEVGNFGNARYARSLFEGAYANGTAPHRVPPALRRPSW